MSRRPAPRAQRRAGTPPPIAPVAPGHPASLLALAVAVGCVVAAVSYRIVDTDFWQHLVVGREIVTTGRVPLASSWVWPPQDSPALSPSWGFRVLLWKAWELGGFAGLQTWRWIAALAAIGLGALAARRMGATGFSALGVAACAVLPLRVRIEPRPETLAYVLLAATLLALETARGSSAIRGGEARPGLAALWPRIAIPLLALVWANAHISWWLGLAVQSLYLADAFVAGRRQAARRAWIRPGLVTLGLSAAISFVNPGGWRTLAEPIEYWAVWRHEQVFRQISELMPVYWPDNTRNLLPLFMAGWPLLIALRALRRRFDLAEIGLGAMLIAQALPASRFVGFFVVAAAPFMARDLGEALAGLRVPRAAASPWARCALMAALTGGALALEWGNPLAPPGLGQHPLWRPLAACDFIEREGLRGRGFNSFEFGGYLLWRFHPQADRRPFADIHLTGTLEDRRLTALARDDVRAWHDLDRKYRFDWVMLNRFQSGGWPITDFLDADTSFALVFVDDTAAIWVRRAGATREIADRLGYRLLRAGYAASPAILEAVRDTATQAEFRRELARVTAGSPFHATALSWDANLLYREGRLEEARAALRGALAIHAHFPFANTRLAEVALALGRPAEALAAARRARRLDLESDRLPGIESAARGRRGPPDEPIVPARLPDGWPRGN